MIKRPRAAQTSASLRLAFAKAGDKAVPTYSAHQHRERIPVERKLPLGVRETYAPRTTIRLVVSETETMNPTNARVNDGALLP